MALQTGFSDSNIGYNAAPATGNAQQSPGMPYKSASDPNYPPRQPPAAGQFGQYNQSNQYGAQGYTQISSTTNSYPEGSAGNKDLGVTDQELQALLAQKDIATSLAEDLLKHFGSEDLDVKEESSVMNNNGTTLSSGPFSPSNLDEATREKIRDIKIEKIDDTATHTNSSNSGSSCSPKLENSMHKGDGKSTTLVGTIKCEATSSTNKIDTHNRTEPTLKLESLCDIQPENELNIEMDSKAILESAKGHGSCIFY